jgi:hypothetical protein
MGDITERLERFAAHANPPLVADERELLREAATLITSLREALEEIAALTVRQQLPITSQVHELARTALNRKDAGT